MPTDQLREIRNVDGDSIKFYLKMALLASQMGAFPAAATILNNLIALKVATPMARLMLAYVHGRADPTFSGRHQMLELVSEYPHFKMARALLALEDRERGVAGWQGVAESLVGGQDSSALLASYMLNRTAGSEMTFASPPPQGLRG